MFPVTQDPRDPLAQKVIPAQWESLEQWACRD